ncbi:MAG TPA: MraY family glycosyltransferase [Chloroflexia bacterium]|nr:MraY family glycosyltransferase [Chloroflexia bacterium]
MAAVAVLTLIMSLVLTPLVRRWAVGRGWVDVPGEERRVHKVAVPRLGGIAMFAAFTAGVLLTFAFPDLRRGKVGNEQFEVTRVLLMLAGAAIITAVMAVDDVRGLKPMPRLLWQIGAALLVVVPSLVWPGGANPDDLDRAAVHYDQGAGVLVTAVQNPFGGTLDLPLALGVFLTIFWIVGTTNAINWIDGLDGLAATVSAVACLALFAVMAFVLDPPQLTLAYLPLLLLAAILGFLPYNLHPARIFMGDSGAMFLGFTLAVLAVIGGAKAAAALLVLGIPILDGAYMIVYRLYRGRAPTVPDRGHLHHRLHDIGLTQNQVVLVYLALCGVFGAVGVLEIPRLIKLGAMVAMVVLLVALFFFISRRQFDLQAARPAPPAAAPTRDKA